MCNLCVSSYQPASHSLNEPRGQVCTNTALHTCLVVCALQHVGSVTAGVSTTVLHALSLPCFLQHVSLCSIQDFQDIVTIDIGIPIMITNLTVGTGATMQKQCRSQVVGMVDQHAAKAGVCTQLPSHRYCMSLMHGMHLCLETLMRWRFHHWPNSMRSLQSHIIRKSAQINTSGNWRLPGQLPDPNCHLEFSQCAGHKSGRHDGLLNCTASWADLLHHQHYCRHLVSTILLPAGPHT